MIYKCEQNNHCRVYNLQNHIFIYWRIKSCCSYTIGTIIDISDIMNQPYKFITIGKVPGDIYTYTRLVYSEETIILDHEYNEIGVEDLKVGDTVVAFHSNAMTMSIPPQTSVFIIEVK